MGLLKDEKRDQVNFHRLAGKRRSHHYRNNEIDNFQEINYEVDDGFIRESDRFRKNDSNEDLNGCKGDTIRSEANNSKNSKNFKPRDESESKKPNERPDLDENSLKSKADALHQMGYQFRKQGDYEKAIKYYTKAIEAYPKHFRVRV